MAATKYSDAWFVKSFMMSNVTDALNIKVSWSVHKHEEN